MLCQAQLALNEVNSVQEQAELHRCTAKLALLKSWIVPVFCLGLYCCSTLTSYVPYRQYPQTYFVTAPLFSHVSPFSVHNLRLGIQGLIVKAALQTAQMFTQAVFKTDVELQGIWQDNLGLLTILFGNITPQAISKEGLYPNPTPSQRQAITVTAGGIPPSS